MTSDSPSASAGLIPMTFQLTEGSYPNICCINELTTSSEGGRTLNEGIGGLFPLSPLVGCVGGLLCWGAASDERKRRAIKLRRQCMDSFPRTAGRRGILACGHRDVYISALAAIGKRRP